MNLLKRIVCWWKGHEWRYSKRYRTCRITHQLERLEVTKCRRCDVLKEMHMRVVLTLALLLSPLQAFAADVRLAWDASKNADGTPAQNIKTYRLYKRTLSGKWSYESVGNVTTKLLRPCGNAYRYKVSAVDTEGRVSDFSNEIEVRIKAEQVQP